MTPNQPPKSMTQTAQIQYYSITHNRLITIEVESVNLITLLDAYNSLFAFADDGGAFPGSKLWRKAKVYWDQLQTIRRLRPEIDAYRDEQIESNRRESDYIHTEDDL